MKLERFEVPGLAHYSYLVGSKGAAVVVDPKRDIDAYLDYARANQFQITHIVETHIHADYASGARQLGQATGASLCLSGHDKNQEFQYQFPHRELMDGDSFDLGDLRVLALHTPGHTPEHLSFVLTDKTRCGQSFALMSGDFVFVGSLGRPDLLGEEAKQKLAGELFESVHRKIAGLPDYLEIYPCHGAGSLCGAGMSDRAQSTLGYERVCNIFMADRAKADFVESILATVPPFPDYYRRMKRINSEGPELLNGVPGATLLSAQEFREATQGDVLIVDLRRPESFGGSHIPASINIGSGGNLPLWAGWMLPYGKPIYLVGDEATNIEEARRMLVRVGHDDIRGSLRGGMKAWIEAGFEQSEVPQISVVALEEKMDAHPTVLDLRNPSEWKAGHIAGAIHIPNGDLEARIGEVPPADPVYAICGSGYRSSIATSILLKRGLTNIINVNGGMNAWKARKFPVVRESPEQVRVA